MNLNQIDRNIPMGENHPQIYQTLAGRGTMIHGYHSKKITKRSTIHKKDKTLVEFSYRTIH